MIHFKLEIDDIKSDMFMDLVCNVVTKTFYQVDCYCEGVAWHSIDMSEAACTGITWGGYEALKVVVDDKDITEYITVKKINSLISELNEQRIENGI